jgi:simple sugar transport system substrate-binding protein
LVSNHSSPHSLFHHYLHEHICHHERWIAFQDVLTKHHIVAKRLHIPGEQPTAGAKQIALFLNENPEIDVVFTLGPPGAQAVLEAASLVQRETKHLTFDVAPLQIEAIRSGRIMATVDSQQYLQGYLSVEWMLLYIRHGFTLSCDLYTGPVIVDQHNVEAAAEGVKSGFR